MKSPLDIYPGSIVSDELCVKEDCLCFLMRTVRDISPFRKRKLAKRDIAAAVIFDACG